MYTKEVLEKVQGLVVEASDSLSRALEFVGQEDCEFFVLEEASSVIINLFKALVLMVNEKAKED